MKEYLDNVINEGIECVKNFPHDEAEKMFKMFMKGVISAENQLHKFWMRRVEEVEDEPQITYYIMSCLNKFGKERMEELSKDNSNKDKEV